MDSKEIRIDLADWSNKCRPTNDDVKPMSTDGVRDYCKGRVTISLFAQFRDRIPQFFDIDNIRFLLGIL